jgi:hypothetical protein
VAQEWQRIANSTIHDYLRKEMVNILRSRKLLAMLDARGRITFNHTGDLMDWKIRYKRAGMRTFTEMDVLTFQRVNRRKTAQLDYRGYAATDMITKFERLKNKGKSAIIKVYENMGKELTEDIKENFADEAWVDGNATGNTGRLHGIESFLAGDSASTFPYVDAPNDSYAGLTTSLGNYGGAWSGTWPNGKGDPEYDFWTPLIVDVTDSSWTETTDTWADDCVQCVSFAVTHGARAKQEEGQVDMCLFQRESYRLLKEKLRTKERLVIDSGDTLGLYQLGFKDVVNIDGVDCSTEWGLPATDGAANVVHGYGVNLKSVELCCMQEELFDLETPDFDIAQQAERMAITFFGNYKWNPRGVVAFKEIT